MLSAKAPIIYIHDTSAGLLEVAAQLESLIPVSKTAKVLFSAAGSVDDRKAAVKCDVKKSISSAKAKSLFMQDTTVIFTDQSPQSPYQKGFSIGSFAACEYQAAATEMGRNFVCVVLSPDVNKNDEEAPKPVESAIAKRNPTAINAALEVDICAFGGPNHLKLNVSNLSAADAAKKVYEHLFKVLPIKEHLHLIPEAQMKITDKNFPEYVYCPLAEAKNRPKSDLLQFVCLIESPPEVRNGYLHWRVVDRSGIGNFYFKWQDEAKSAYTWNWVLSLKPGDRKALPRRPTTGKEADGKKGLGFTMVPGPVKGVRKMVAGVCIANAKMCLWFADKVHPEGKKGKDGRNKVVKKDVVVFDEKGEKTWDSDDETVASDTSFNEKTPSSFC